MIGNFDSYLQKADPQPGNQTTFSVQQKGSHSEPDDCLFCNNITIKFLLSQ